jgi:DNA-binding protein H-NS
MNMNLTELLAAKAALEADIAKAKKTEAAVALRRVQELVTEFGFTSQQVFPLLPEKAKNQGVAKYRNEATGATWTGRGKPPAWIIGKDRSEFLIAEHTSPDGPFLAEMAAAAVRNRS